jgi:hypothetical protein
MSAGRYTFSIEQGATWDQTLTWSIDGAPVDLSGFSARMMVRASVAAPTAILVLDDVAGIDLGGVAGTIRLSRSAAQTSAIPAGSFVYDLELVSASGFVTRLLEGAFRVKPEVTR